MKKIEKVLDTVMRFLMAIAMLTLLVFGTWQIFTRWILGNPSTFTDELLRYVLIIAGFIGSAYCFYRDWSSDVCSSDLAIRKRMTVSSTFSIFFKSYHLLSLLICGFTSINGFFTEESGSAPPG